MRRAEGALPRARSQPLSHGTQQSRPPRRTRVSSALRDRGRRTCARRRARHRLDVSSPRASGLSSAQGAGREGPRLLGATRHETKRVVAGEDRRAPRPRVCARPSRLCRSRERPSQPRFRSPRVYACHVPRLRDVRGVLPRQPRRARGARHRAVRARESCRARATAVHEKGRKEGRLAPTSLSRLPSPRRRSALRDLRSEARILSRVSSSERGVSVLSRERARNFRRRRALELVPRSPPVNSSVYFHDPAHAFRSPAQRVEARYA